MVWTERDAAQLRERGCQGISDWDLIEARLQGAARRRLMRADEQEEARNGSPKLQCDGLPVPNLQVNDLNCDHRDPAQVLRYLRALRRELRAAFFPRGSLWGTSRRRRCRRGARGVCTCTTLWVVAGDAERCVTRW